VAPTNLVWFGSKRRRRRVNATAALNESPFASRTKATGAVRSLQIHESGRNMAGRADVRLNEMMQCGGRQLNQSKTGHARARQ
jgi:hypothetical protein